MKNRPVLTSLALLATFVALDRPEVAHSQDTAVATRPALEAEPIPGMKSEGTATPLSIVGTVVPTGLGILLASASEDSGDGSGLAALVVTYGIYFGPATGYWYAGAPGRGFAGVGVRLGTSLVGGALMAAADNDDSGWGLSDGATAVAIATLTGLAISMIYDISSVNNEVRNRNVEMAARHETSRLTIAPIVSPADGGTVGVLGRLQL